MRRSPDLTHNPVLPRVLPYPLALLAALMAPAGVAAQQVDATPPPLQPIPTDGQVIMLDPFKSLAEGDDPSYDSTGMGAMEMERDEAPFSNDLLAGTGVPDDAASAIDVEIGQLGAAPTADLSAGQSRLDIRGFPTPRLRNGFTQLGVPDVLNPDRNEQITGPLVSVTGRAAPGGITNLVTARPKARVDTTLGLSFGTADSQRVWLDATRVLVPRRAWSRTSTSLSHKAGPETFTNLRQRSLGQSLTRKLTRATSVMIQVDWTDFRGRPSGGMPEHRLTRTGKIMGPWRPLAAFHTNGPDSGQHKRLASVAAQLESQVRRNLAVRATAQWFSRRFAEDRFTKGEYIVDEGVFSGTREPRHSEQPLDTLSGQLEATLRLHGLGADHKVLVSAEGSRSLAHRRDRALSAEDRAAQPATVRTFDPEAPDWTRPAYSEFNYKRVLTDRDEETLQSAFTLSERAAWAGGRLVGTAGMRRDWVNLEVADKREGAPLPLVRDRSGKLTWHAGANWVARPGKLLVFANASTAFEPSLRIDGRTGRIQGNESTIGWETGATGTALARRFSYTLTFFRFENTNIARRNPLYDHPVYDADNTQPQLVAGGRERFQGGVVELRWKPSPLLTLSMRESYTSAITTASPDLPEEVGRQLSRLPRAATSANARLAPTAGRWTGAWLSLGATYIGPHTAWYESSTRARLDYPGYTILNTAAGWRIKQRKLTHALQAGVRNALDADLLARIARVGAGREFTFSHTVQW